MFFEQFQVDGLGCFSYMIGCPGAGTCCVVDPERHIERYIECACKNNLKITHIFETHVHADHISGAQRLSKQTKAPIFIHESAPVHYNHVPLSEGDEFLFGKVKIQIIESFGHTPNSTSLIVTDLIRKDIPWMILTGDLLMVGSVGRPDLVGDAVLEEQIQNLYNSFHKKLSNLPEFLEVYPAHGSGSLCGKGLSLRKSTTLGYEFKANPLLTMEFKDFHNEMNHDFPVRPLSFHHIIDTNCSDMEDIIDPPFFNALSPDEVEEKIKNGAVVVDVRDQSSFGGAHIPGALNIGIGASAANWLGMMVDPQTEVIYVGADENQTKEAFKIFWRVGYDSVAGWLKGGVAQWIASGRKIDTLEQISGADVKKYIKTGEAIILDVRNESERRSDKIEGSLFIPLTNLVKEKIDLPSKKIIVHCASGYRSNIAGSYLKSAGIKDVSSLAGGINAWNKCKEDV